MACQASLSKRILQARIMGWFSMLSSRGSSQPGSNSGLPHYRQSPYHLSYQGSPGILELGAYSFSMGLPDPEIEPGSPALQTDSLLAELPRKPIYVFSHFSHVSLFATLMDHKPPDFPVHGILQARILKWIAISFSRGYPSPKDQAGVSCIAGRFFTHWAMREAHRRV